MSESPRKVYVASSVGIDYFFFLGDMIRAAGYEVEELYLISEESYRRRARRSGLGKIWLRIQMYIFYPAYLVARGIRCDARSTFVVSSNTFFAPYLLYKLLRFRGIKVVHMLYDLFPDAIEIANGLSRTSVISRAVGWVARGNQACDATVYLGRFLQKHAEARWGAAKRSKVIDVSADLSLYDSSFRPFDPQSPLIIHYGGQLGHLHDAPSIIEAVSRVCQSDLAGRVRFNFYVSGARAQLLRESFKELPIDVVSTAPSAQWRRDIKGFHVGLVSLSPGGASVCLPSKTYAMMAAGLAILAITPAWSDLAKLVHSLDAGWVINNSFREDEPDASDPDYFTMLQQPRDIDAVVQDFVATIALILEDRNRLETRRRNATDGMREHLAIGDLCRKWDRLLSSLGEKACRSNGM